ncbi:probable 28S ribosomal protein S16, mitochondrial [Pararge aegeria]|uniref:Small ribosomal subunit protein bS16m n=2 Tax=Pararge aegeria TaxID=116150 RepID=A0A8S4RVM5_9NEOP|nr:probable 28S ribosomal protein S16, mitochondrial [Pararge aegeria]CAH2242254.1 jg25187 [Pararge aegeria aegeria]
MPLPPASGTGRYFARAAKSIRLIRQGCTNRPFFHISVTHRRRLNSQPVIEQLGSYDPMPNINNEKLVALNLERIKYWLGQGAHVTNPVGELLGLAGFFPIHPRSYMTAWRNRKTSRENQAKAEQQPMESKA